MQRIISFANPEIIEIKPFNDTSDNKKRIESNKNENEKNSKKDNTSYHIYIIISFLLLFPIPILNFVLGNKNKNSIINNTNITSTDNIVSNINIYILLIINGSFILFYAIMKIIVYIFAKIINNANFIDFNFSYTHIILNICIMVGILTLTCIAIYIYVKIDITNKLFLNLLWGNFIINLFSMNNIINFFVYFNKNFIN